VDLILDKDVIGVIVYLMLTLFFTSRFIEDKFEKLHKENQDLKNHTDKRDDENEAHIRRLEVILQVHYQGFLKPPYDISNSDPPTKFKGNPEGFESS